MKMPAKEPSLWLSSGQGQRYQFSNNKRMVLVTTDLCLNLNRLSLNPLKA
jgi:hypothetical protein